MIHAAFILTDTVDYPADIRRNCSTEWRKGVQEVKQVTTRHCSQRCIHKWRNMKRCPALRNFLSRTFYQSVQPIVTPQVLGGAGVADPPPWVGKLCKK